MDEDWIRFLSWLIKLRKNYDLTDDECVEIFNSALEDIIREVGKFESGKIKQSELTGTIRDIALPLLLEELLFCINEDRPDVNEIKILIYKNLICLQRWYQGSLKECI